MTTLTAPRIAQTFQVDYTYLTLESRWLSVPLATETFLPITTESSATIEIEFEGDASVVTAHRIRQNAFIVEST